jgi:hypothetical protein
MFFKFELEKCVTMFLFKDKIENLGYKRIIEGGKRNFPYKIWQIGLEYACSKNS